MICELVVDVSVYPHICDPMSNVPLNVNALKALAAPVKWRILGVLPRRSVCKLFCNTSELAGDLKLPQSTVFRHLAILLKVNLVRKERACRDVYYRLNLPQLNAVRRAIAQLGLTPQTP